MKGGAQNAKYWHDELLQVAFQARQRLAEFGLAKYIKTQWYPPCIFPVTFVWRRALPAMVARRASTRHTRLRNVRDGVFDVGGQDQGDGLLYTARVKARA